MQPGGTVLAICPGLEIPVHSLVTETLPQPQPPKGPPHCQTKKNTWKKEWGRPQCRCIHFGSNKASARVRLCDKVIKKPPQRQDPGQRLYHDAKQLKLKESPKGELRWTTSLAAVAEQNTHIVIVAGESSERQGGKNMVWLFLDTRSSRQKKKE